MKTHYIIQLFNDQENWTYKDDYYRVVEFSTEKEAEEKIKDIFSWAFKDIFSWASYGVTSAKVIKVTEEEVAHLDNVHKTTL